MLSRLKQDEIKSAFSQYLGRGEQVLAIGVFKKMPSTGWLLLSKGMAWFFTPEFYAAVKDRRLIFLPASRFKGRMRAEEDVFTAELDEVELSSDALNNTILDIRKSYDGEPLKLRFRPGASFLGMDQFDFIAALKGVKVPGVVGVTN